MKYSLYFIENKKSSTLKIEKDLWFFYYYQAGFTFDSFKSYKL